MTDTPAPHSGPTPCSGCTRRTMLVGAGVAAAAAITTGCARGSAVSAPARVPLADVPVGGGRVYREQRLVVTQPTSGEVRAYSATCPHHGCTVRSVHDGTIECPCHGSRFSITDGSPLRGPAREPLPSRTVTIEATEIIIQ